MEKKSRNSKTLLKNFGLKTERIEVQFIKMGKVTGGAGLLRDDEVNFGQVDLSSRQIYQVDLKSGFCKTWTGHEIT